MMSSRRTGTAAVVLIGVSAIACLICVLYPLPSSHKMRSSPLQWRRSLSLPVNPVTKYRMKSITMAPDPSRETALFWHIPKSGGSTVKSLYKCMQLTLAVRVDPEGDELRVKEADGAHFVNVDTISKEGILRAQQLGLVPSGMADMIVTTSYLNFALEHLYDNQHKGRVLAMFRHPVDRLVSLFYYLGEATWERTYQPDWKQMDIKYWAENINKESNIMVKSLVGKPWSQEATEDDLTLAIGTLKSKFVIGLMNQMEESVHRFNVILGINENEEVKNRCMRGYFGHGVKKKNSHSHPKVEEGSPAWEVLARDNEFDIRLYEIIVRLFDEQRDIIRAYASQPVWNEDGLE